MRVRLGLGLEREREMCLGRRSPMCLGSRCRIRLEGREEEEEKEEAAKEAKEAEEEPKPTVPAPITTTKADTEKATKELAELMSKVTIQ